MIPLAEVPTTDGVYVIHFSAPLAHAHGYVGWSADIARRVAEHLNVEACRAGFHVAGHRGSPLVCAAVRAGRSVQVAQVYPGGDRGLERRLHESPPPADLRSVQGAASAATEADPPAIRNPSAGPFAGPALPALEASPCGLA